MDTARAVLLVAGRLTLRPSSGAPRQAGRWWGRLGGGEGAAPWGGEADGG